jgi:HSP20 family protein
MFALTPFNKNELQKREGHTFVDFYNLMDDFFNDNFLRNGSLRADTFKLDVKDQGSAFLVEAELPGIKKEEIQLSYENEYLTIKVSRSEEKKEEKENYVHRERRQSSMERTVYMKGIDAGKIEASLEEGVLKMVLPKKEAPEKGQKIEIK